MCIIVLITFILLLTVGYTFVFYLTIKDMTEEEKEEYIKNIYLYQDNNLFPY